MNKFWVTIPGEAGEVLMKNVDELVQQNAEMLDVLKKLLEEPRNMEYWLDAENAIAKVEEE